MTYRVFLLLVAGALVGSVSCSPKPAVDATAEEERPQFQGNQLFEASVENMIGTPDDTIYPPIGYPRYISANEASAFLSDTDPVFFLRSGQVTYVYPEIILATHHVVNDTIANRPVLITQCFMADSAILYSRMVKGKASAFGALGTAYYGNLVMYDFDTDSYWLQLRGESFHGKRRHEKLEAIQALERTSWGRIKDLEYLKVLPPELAVSRYRKVHSVVADFASGREVPATVDKPDDRLAPLTRGLGIVVHGQAQFYPLDTVKANTSLNDEVGGWALLVLQDEVLGPARIFRRYIGGRILSFAKSGSILQDRETKSKWSSEGLCVSGELASKTLVKPAYTQALWYSWSAFYPETEYYEAPAR